MKTAVVVMVAGGVLLATSIIATASETTDGDPQPAPAAAVRPIVPPVWRPAPVAPPTSAPVATSIVPVGSETATPTASPPAPTTAAVVAGAAPAQISFLTNGATAPVRPVGVLPSGELQLPDDPTVVGWWAGGAAMGTGAGSIVVAGHVDSRRFGIGTFSTLHELGPGDAIELTDELGQVQRFTVTERQRTAKTALAPELFATNGPSRLVLLTCGGAFDEASRHYADNVIVIATPTQA